jgi:hypothetical protein
MLLSVLKYKKNGKIYKTQKVTVMCDKCKKEYELPFYYYIKGNQKNDSDICKPCITRLLQKGKTIEERLGNSKAIEMKNKLSLFIRTNGSPAKGYRWTKDQKENLKKARPNNLTYEEKYGIEKSIEMKNNLSIKSSGKNNPMYNKLSPQGSGNGWSGWYKGWYFRSLRELSYMINVIEANNQQWISCENAKYSIPYKFMGADRIYFADFIIDNKYMIEIKPQKLLNTPNVLAKKEAAINWCQVNNLTYILISDKEFSILSQSSIKTLHDKSIIKFIDRYEEKYKENYNG